MTSDTSQDVESVGRRSRCEEGRNREPSPLGPTKELHGPLSDPHRLYVDIPTWLGFVQVLVLSDERQRLFGAGCALREGKRFRVCRKGTVSIVGFAVDPNTVFEYGIPDEAATRLGNRGVS